MRAVKPVLVKVGNQYIEPGDIAAITKCKRMTNDDEERPQSLYIVRLKSNPNPEFPIWVRGDTAINKLLKYFKVEE